MGQLDGDVGMGPDMDLEMEMQKWGVLHVPFQRRARYCVLHGAIICKTRLLQTQLLPAAQDSLPAVESEGQTRVHVTAFTSSEYCGNNTNVDQEQATAAAAAGE